jgi:hypothetical protein
MHYNDLSDSSGWSHFPCRPSFRSPYRAEGTRFSTSTERTKSFSMKKYAEVPSIVTYDIPEGGGELNYAISIATAAIV